MPDNRFRRIQLMLAKIEGTYGTDSAPEEANSYEAIRLIEPFEVDMTQDFIEVQPGNNTMGFDRPLGTTRPIGVTFRTFVKGTPQGSYTATQKPPIGDLLRACGLFETFVASNASGQSEYSYAPAAHPSSHASMTLVAHNDGLDQRLLGSRGNVNFIFAANAPVIAEFTFRGQLSTETETARGTASFPDLIPPRWIDSGSVLVNSYCFDIENLNLNTNYTVYEQPSACAGSGSGIVAVLLTERQPGGSLDPIATRTNTHDALAEWRSSSGAVLYLNAGLTAGNRFSITGSFMIYKDVSWGDKSGLSIFNTDYQLYQRGSGNNELSINFVA